MGWLSTTYHLLATGGVQGVLLASSWLRVGLAKAPPPDTNRCTPSPFLDAREAKGHVEAGGSDLALGLLVVLAVGHAPLALLDLKEVHDAGRWTGGGGRG